MKYIESFNMPGEKILGTDPHISESAIVSKSSFGEYTEILANVRFIKSILGDYSYICENCDIIYTDIGKFSNIAISCRINPGNHPMERPSLHHFTYRRRQFGFMDADDDEFFNWRSIQKVKIGHDTWLGHGVIIMPGVSIGNGAVIGSGSVVTKNIPPYMIAAGVPAKVIRPRFPAEIAEKLSSIAWWDWPHDKIKDCMEDFRDLRRFLARHG
ncbi:MAG: DapH/DapD/GlmU-related protein [Brevinematales bacterium]